MSSSLPMQLAPLEGTSQHSGEAAVHGEQLRRKSSGGGSAQLS